MQELEKQKSQERERQEEWERVHRRESLASGRGRQESLSSAKGSRVLTRKATTLQSSIEGLSAKFE